ncbi:hypothetical protein [Nonomuraea sp. NPDC003709]|uniref:hypothetical protein n=1 Tax=Nonomuraea sp. NPDC003709 TaxID=3154450 RepID=UPI0033BA62AF
MHHTTRLSPWPAKHCPRCTAQLDGGPVQFYCALCRRAVFAADINNEMHAPLRRAA